ncbi:MAG: PIN domain-containing protein [Propionibacteriaceae bacterium]|nr:PIN domain-containing protein [Propionibacteriaceae bacterium]
MPTQSVDTNVLLRAAIDLGDSQTDQARNLLALADHTFRAEPIVFAEFVYALTTHYGLTRQQAGTLVRWVLAIESVDCDRNTLTAATAMFESHPKLSFEDCLLAEQAASHGALPLWTFDQKLARQHPAARLVGRMEHGWMPSKATTKPTPSPESAPPAVKDTRDL